MSLNIVSGFKKFIRPVAFCLGIFYLSLTGGGGCNVFSDFGTNTSDDAIIYHATQQIDASQWDGAISTLGTLTAAGQSRRDAKILLATAYAGRGGLNLITFAQTLQNNSGNLTIFQLLMRTYTGATAANINDLINAETVVQTISVIAALRTADENVFMMFLELAKIGAIVSASADIDGDGSLDGAFDSCLNISLPYADQVVTALSNLIASAQASGSTIASNFINGIAANCAVVPGVCSKYTTASVTALDESLAQTLIGETAQSIGLAVPSQTGICEIPPAGANCHGSGTGLCP